VAEQFRSHIQGAKLAFIDHCGHAPPIEQPKKFAQLLDAFLDSNSEHHPYAISKPR
jgi:pimeloyl-ACP methyl ester carboxylesterase